MDEENHLSLAVTHNFMNKFVAMYLFLFLISYKFCVLRFFFLGLAWRSNQEQEYNCHDPLPCHKERYHCKP